MKLLFKTPSIPIYVISSDNLKGQLSTLSPCQQNWASDNGFSGKLGEILCLPDGAGMLEGVLFGIGNAHTRERDRLIFGGLPLKLPMLNYHFVNNDAFDANQVAIAWLLGTYKFSKSQETTHEKANLVISENVDKDLCESIAGACAFAQDLINEPANIMTPEKLDDLCAEFAVARGANYQSIIGDALLRDNFPMIHAVGRASSVEPRLIEFTWGDPTHPKLTLVGKGVCFDTGGLNIKPGSSMGLMKKDMGGAANVMGLASMIIDAQLPVYLKVLIPAVENSISANAFRPSDILTARDGKTVEINNTDAEGRLVLADALAYASESNPDQIISMATLTGAARVAMGPDISPFFTTSDAFAAELSAAALKVEDPLWRLPFWAPYESMIEPGIADLDNAPAGGFAGAITAALFLNRFAEGQNYTHFDIYGWTPVAKSGRAKGGAAQGIRAIFETLRQTYNSK